MPFRLTENFLNNYKNKKPHFGPIGEITYRRTYSRQLEDGMEEFWQTIKRVVEGVYNIQEKHCRQFKLPWLATKAQRSAQEMYERMFEMKFLPPGRGLWAMGTEITDKLGSAALMNCAFASSKDLKTDFAGPFCFLMDMSMLGVGVGFDTLGAKTVTIKEPQTGNTQVVEDSREGWVALIRRVLDAYGNGSTLPSSVDYSKIRPSGAPLKTFGGVAAGSKPLEDCVEDIHNILEPLVGEQITSEAIVDLMNVIGKCVVSGNIRRSAELAIGELEDTVFLNLKNKETNKKAMLSHRWASNNSVSAKIASDYTEAAILTIKNGEPGYVWLDNARAYGRMEETKYPDPRVMGFNPCVIGNTDILTDQGWKTAKELVELPFIAVVNDNCYQSWGFFSTGVQKITKIITESEHELECTDKHKVLFEDNDLIRTWEQVRHLYIGAKIVLNNNLVTKIKSITPTGFDEEVYDCQVEEVHAFVANGIIVHNCVEQPLEDREMCCLVETFPARHDDYHDYQRTLKFAYLYGKTVTLVPTHDERTNAVIMRNRRIGTSQSGVIQNFKKIGKRKHFEWCNNGYQYLRELDEVYSDWLCIPRSIKVTTVKPSGTVSLLPGATPGIHYPQSEYYFRTIRFSSNSTLIPVLRKAGYRIETDKYSPNTEVIYFPVHEDYFDRAKRDVTLWEQLENTAQMQKWWSDNGVSATITFKQEEAKDIKEALELYETRLKAISFLPLDDHGYEQAPYQEISKAEYEEYIDNLSKIKLKNVSHEITDSMCDGETCLVPAK